MQLTNKEEHKKKIINYLKDNKLSPFSMFISKGMMYLQEAKVEQITNSPIEYMVLINKDNIKKDKNGYVDFIYQKVRFKYFAYPNDISLLGYYDNISGKHDDEMFEICHVYEENVRKSYWYDKWWKELFCGWFEKTKEFVHLEGYMYEKHKDTSLKSEDQDIPFRLEEEKNVCSNNYHLTFLTV